MMAERRNGKREYMRNVVEPAQRLADMLTAPSRDLTAERAAAEDITEWAAIIAKAYSSGKLDMVKQCVEIVRKRATRQREPQEIRSIHKIRCDEAKFILALLARLASEGG